MTPENRFQFSVSPITAKRIRQIAETYGMSLPQFWRAVARMVITIHDNGMTIDDVISRIDEIVNVTLKPRR